MKIIRVLYLQGEMLRSMALIRGSDVTKALTIAINCN